MKEEIWTLVKSNRLKEALKLFEVERKADKVQPLRGMYSHLIGACGRAGYTKKAFTLYNDMKKRGWDPNPGTYTALFNACANSPWIEDGLQRATYLRIQLKDKNMLLNVKQYHSMIKAFGRCGELTAVFEILDEMASKGIAVKTETYNFVLQACITQKKDGFRAALLVWRRMRRLNIEPDLFSFNLMLRCARDCGIGTLATESPVHPNYLLESGSPNESITATEPVETRSILPVAGKIDSPVGAGHDLMTVSQMPSSLPNFLARNVACRSLISLDQLDQPENRLALLGGVGGFFNQLRKDRVAPDIKTVTLLLETSASNLLQEKILIESADKMRVAFDVDFFNLLIKKRQYRREHAAAREVLNMLQTRKITPDVVTFGVLALGCFSMKEADALITDMDKNGFRMNIEVFGSLLKNAIVRHDCSYIINLMNRAIELELTLDEKALLSLAEFKSTVTSRMAKSDRSETRHKLYDSPRFRTDFRNFCFNYNRWLKELKVSLKPHPWEQYRYELHRSE